MKFEDVQQTDDHVQQIWKITLLKMGWFTVHLHEWWVKKCKCFENCSFQNALQF